MTEVQLFENRYIFNDNICAEVLEVQRKNYKSMATATLDPQCRATEVGDAFTLRETYLTTFGSEPQAIVRAPGRVNLIGEHIDYNGYSVLPIAIEQSIFVAIGPSKDEKIRIVNLDPAFEAFSCDLTSVKNIGSPPKWYDYVLCGLQGIQEHLDLTLSSGANLAVLGRVPKAAGLSSSSALVCAAALAGVALFAKCRGVEVKPLLENTEKDPDGQRVTEHTHDAGVPSLHSVSFKELAHVCAMAEKYVGTQGGGMDQAASLLSKRGSAQLISFNPLTCDDVTLPPGACFVVANSMVTANKAATEDFNTRVVECRLATAVLAKTSRLDWQTVVNMADLQRQLGNVSFDHMLTLVENTLHQEPYTLDEVAEILSTTSTHVVSQIFSKNTKGVKSFSLKPRALHVFSEAKRVQDFRKTCDLWRDGQSQQSLDETLRSLGALMLASHESGQRQYCCSHQDLDLLVQLSSPHALGARLTGAGWGGCTVALVPQEKVATHCTYLHDQFYKDRGVAEPQLGEVLFCSTPAAGAAVVWVAEEVVSAP